MRPILDDEAEVRVRQTAAKRFEGGKRVDDVSHGAQANEEDARACPPKRVGQGRRRTHQAGCPLRMLIGAISWRRQFRSGTTNVSTNACWPEMTAWLTMSVKTIHAQKGFMRNS